MTDAVVVGLCSHGLSVCRSLARAGASALAIESNDALPGVRTRSAAVEIVPSIGRDDLVDTLLALAARHDFAAHKPWLFPTNDGMVRAIGDGWGALANFYRLSWDRSRDRVLELLDKAGIAKYCEAAGVDFPKSEVVRSPADCDALSMSFPAAVKPAEPMGSFKAIEAGDIDAVRRIVADHPESLPVVVQEWIPGGTEQLVFAAGFAVDGEFVADFTGHKVRSWPLDSGQGSVVAPRVDPEVLETAARFLRATGMTGPIAIEFKRRPDGGLALIEPNVGRTEYCTEAATANQVDLAGIELRWCRGDTLAPAPQSDRRVWCDTERDLGSVFAALGYLFRRRRWLWPVTPYASLRDPEPWARAMGRTLVMTAKNAVRKAVRWVRGK